MAILATAALADRRSTKGGDGTGDTGANTQQLVVSEHVLDVSDSDKLPGVAWYKYKTGTYVSLPVVLRPLFYVARLRKILVVGLPSMSPSAGLKGFREVVPKKLRKSYPFQCVIDKPGLNPEGFLEQPNFVEVFNLDVSSYRSEADFLKGSLRANNRRNWKIRTKRLADRKDLRMETAVLNAPNATATGAEQRQLIDQMWRLYVATGERNGLVILSQSAFVHMHGTLPELKVVTVRVAESGALLAFATAFKYHDTVLPQWVGIDYANDAARSCNLYYNILQEHVRLAIADPTVDVVDMGACHRGPKTAMGFSPVPVSCYVRCPEFARPVMKAALKKFFNPQALMVDP